VTSTLESASRLPRRVGPIATDRLWLTQPRRTTSLAKVVAVSSGHFALDRSLFAPTSHAHRHPQPHDTGTVWVDGGEKRRLDRSFFRDGILWHRLRGTVPDVGATLQCQLDQDRRDLESRAHTAMHLLLAAMQQGNGPALVDDPTVKGGATFRLDLDASVAPKILAGWLAQANAWVADDRTVTHEHVVRGMETKVLDAQRFATPDPFPGPDTTMDAVRIAGVCAYPCDGTHVARTGKVGRITIAQAHHAGGRFVIAARVARPT